jgi:hypothetical protein
LHQIARRAYLVGNLLIGHAVLCQEDDGSARGQLLGRFPGPHQRLQLPVFCVA